MMTSDRSGMLRIALIAAVTIAAFIINILSNIPPSALALPAAGAAAYLALVRLGDYDPRIACDHIQTGEAAIGSFALFVLSLFIPGSPAIPVLVCAAVIIYGLFINTVIAPEKKELAVNGAFTQVILAAAVLMITANGAAAEAIRLEAALLGYFAAIPVTWPFAAAALVPAAAVMCIVWALRPELMSYSQGPSLDSGSGGARAGIAAGIALTRGLMTAAAILLAGWTCGIGVSVRRLSRGPHAWAFTVVSILGFQQVVILATRQAGPWYAWGLALTVSYALYLIYLSKRNHQYDRHQRP